MAKNTTYAPLLPKTDLEKLEAFVMQEETSYSVDEFDDGWDAALSCVLSEIARLKKDSE